MATINLATKEIGSAIKTAAHNFKEYLGKGVRTALWAITLFPIPSAGLCQPSPSLLRGALTAEAAIVALQGSERIDKGESVIEVLKGCIQTVTGVAGAALLSTLDARILAAAHQASVIVLPSAFLMKAGLYDLKKGHYGSGLSKVLVGTGGILSAAYAVYSTYQDQTDDPHERQEFLTEDRKVFLEAHKKEIDEIYEKKSPVGEWTQLGRGASKAAFTHPAREDMIIKIPAMHTIGYRTETPDGDLIEDFRNREKFRPIAARYDQILLPSQALYPTSNGIMIVEQKIKGVDFFDIEDSPGTSRALAQFKDFLKASDLCDLSPKSSHNAEFLSLDLSSIPTIAIYDTDCILRNQDVALFLTGPIIDGAIIIAIAKNTIPWAKNCLARALPTWHFT